MTENTAAGAGHQPKPAHLLKADSWQVEYREKANPRTTNLELLSYGTWRVAAGAASGELLHRSEETLLFSLAGQATVELEGQSYRLAHYDTLYIPLGVAYRIVNDGPEQTLLAACRAAAATTHVPYHARWDDVRQNEDRIRHLEGKDVFLMFDVSERADRLLAGYTIYQPYTRAWPPHNHTDQEEIYIFTQGRGAMEVYADEKSKTFVHSVETMDAVTIPLLNYHPVFSQQEPLHFIWCLAGARYWVGDKHQEFMTGAVDQLTT